MNGGTKTYSHVFSNATHENLYHCFTTYLLIWNVATLRTQNFSLNLYRISS